MLSVDFALLISCIVKFIGVVFQHKYALDIRGFLFGINLLFGFYLANSLFHFKKTGKHSFFFLFLSVNV